MKNRRRGLCLRAQIDLLDDRCLLSAGLTPAQVTAAYGLNALNGNGSGETIALIEAYNDPNIASDLHTFDVAYKLPDPTLKVESQSGTAVSATAPTNSGWTEEESLDVEWAHAIAPGANILVVEANSQSIQDLMTAVDTARSSPGVVAVSMSWGFGETPNETSYDSNFTTPAGHQGITFIASSGDSGSFAGASYPAASPNVLSVGGTTLLLSSSGAYQSESAWIDSGGGYSQYEPEPSYQAKVQDTGFKATPDVAFDGDPNTGVQIYVTLPTRNGTQGSWMTIGGTSLGSPSWAGIIAIVDQGRALAGLGSLDGPTQTLPALYAAPSSDFHTVAATSSSFGGGFGYGYGYGYGYGAFWSSSWNFGGSGLGVSSTTTSTTTGANTATGLGTPIGSALVPYLVSYNLTTPVTPVTGSGGGTTPTPPPNPVGGGFGHHHRLTHAGSHTVSGKTHVEAPARIKHVPQVAVPTKLSTTRSLTD
ncbi:MAG TPA: S53 family peptidase [Isosphaeraceae bacterium]|nr:S53 family peptidase [Isosphaeraceae bacterium]